MRKIVCDICGTTYPETAECCPICGCVREPDQSYGGEDLLAGNGRFPERKKEIFDFDEVNPEPEPEYDLYSDEEEEDDVASYEDEEAEYEEEPSGHSTLLVILLTVLIAGLLLVAGFLAVRFLLPGRNQDKNAVATTQAAAQEDLLFAETTEATIPCDTLTIFSGMRAELSAEGQYFLLNVKAMPENTTDKIIYTSANESIATVTEDGRITAVSEGETTVFISCGKISQECPVIVKYVEETVPATTEAVTAETEAVSQSDDVPQETQSEATAAETTASNTAVDPNVVLKLKKTDIMLGVYYQFTLELDCDLEQDQVQWSSEHPHIATVDDKGVVTAVKSGTTSITAKYGDQEVQCMVRCG